MSWSVARIILLGLGALVSGCAPNKPAPVPVPMSHCAPLCPRDGQPPSERALLSVLSSLVGHMELYRAAGHQPIGVVEDGQASVWQALVIEVEFVRDSIVGRFPACTPQNFTTIVAWRELPDQASAVGFAAWTPHLGRAQSIEPPKPSGCWLRRAAVAGGMFDSFVDLHSAPGYEFAADSGMLSIDRFPSPVDKPCPTPAAWPFKAPGMSCQRLTYSASLSAGIFKPLRRLPGTGSLPAPHNIEFKTWQVPGVRLTIDCMSEASLASMYCGT